MGGDRGCGLPVSVPEHIRLDSKLDAIEDGAYRLLFRTSELQFTDHDMHPLQSAADAMLRQTVSAKPRIPGVCAIATDRHRTICASAAGKRILGGGDDMTTDTVCAIFSATKPIVGTVCLQLMEQGQLDLDVPAKHYVSDLANIRVLDGFAADGALQLRRPKREITTRMLLLHTAGFGYAFFNETYLRLAEEHGYPSVITASQASLNTPLLFDPGDRWEYGSNIDWAGRVIEGVTGKRLGEVMRDQIFDPLGMDDTAFTLSPKMRKCLACIHQREADGSLTPLRDFGLPRDPEVHMGGHGLYSTAEDYIKFIRLWLNDGMGPHGRLLKKETLDDAFRSGLGAMKIKRLPGVMAAVSHDAEFFPGAPKSWGLTSMINDEDAPTGRAAGSLAWAGLANLYYWIDRRNAVGGFWATQLLPFFDPTALRAYLDFETAVYHHLTA